MKFKKQTPLLGGELIIKPKGIFTFMHYYMHPKSKREVLFAGMNHGGDASYFKTIDDILSECGLVLYENILSDKRSTIEKDLEEVGELEKIFSDDIERAVFPSISTFFRQSSKSLGLVPEGESFNYNKPGWICADIYADTELSGMYAASAAQKIMKGLQRIPLKRKKAIVYYVRKSIKKMDNNKFSKKDLGKGFKFFYKDSCITKLLSEIFVKPRDEYALTKFDLLCRTKSPKRVGIKFGAGHIANQRKLLEKRGYIYQSSKELCNIEF